MSAKIIVVFGAAGSQGGSVVEALLGRSEFRVRASTRDASSDKARDLAARGCEVVEASYRERRSLERALEGAYGAWFITSFWDSGVGTVEAEAELGRNVALAAKSQRVQHLIYSTLESPAAQCGLSFPTFDAKVGVEQEILYASVPFTFTQVAWYFNNLENNNPNPHAGWYDWPRDETGAYQLNIPIGPEGLHGIHSGDVGEACTGLFAQPERFIGRKVALSAELLTPESILTSFEGAFPGTRFSYLNMPIETYKATVPSGFGDAPYRMYKWYQTRMPRGGDVALTRELNPKAHTLRSYLSAYKDRYRFD